MFAGRAPDGAIDCCTRTGFPVTDALVNDSFDKVYRR